MIAATLVLRCGGVPAERPGATAEILNLRKLTDAQISGFQELSNGAQEAATAKRLEEASAALAEACGIYDGNIDARYELAGLRASSGHPAAAMDALRSAQDAGFNDPEWPAEDPSLTSLSDRAEFRAWLGEVRRRVSADPPVWPTVTAAPVARTPDSLRRLHAAAAAALERVKPVLGDTISYAKTQELDAWRVASWDAIAEAAPDPESRADAEVEALRVLVPEGLFLSAARANEGQRRAKALRESYAGKPQMADVLLAEARCRWRGDRRGGWPAARRQARARRGATLRRGGAGRRRTRAVIRAVPYGQCA